MSNGLVWSSLKHETEHGEVDDGCDVCGMTFKVPHQSSVSADPGEYPPPGPAQQITRAVAIAAASRRLALARAHTRVSICAVPPRCRRLANRDLQQSGYSLLALEGATVRRKVTSVNTERL
jgi:hypothetical protein